MSSQNYQVFWQEALKQLSEEYKSNGKEDEFKIWFKMDYVEDHDNVIVVNVPSEFLKIQMMSRGYVEQIKSKLMEITGQSDFSIEIQYNNATPVSAPVTSQEKVEVKPVKKEEKKADKKESSGKHHPQLMEKFTFENFVPGDNNNYAYSATLAAAKNPGKSDTLNPILLYGGVGLGKTHLMQSLGNYIYQHDEKAKICFISSENFFNEFYYSLQNNQMNKFKNKYRNYDVFLFDDIQFLIGKESLQEECFHTFNGLMEHHAQMVFTCDRPINELKGIEDRLKTRFSSGVCIDLKPPSYENRIAIIRKKLEIEQKVIRNDVVEYIAKNIQMNVRDLEASIKKIVGYQDLIQTEVTIEIAQDLLKDTISEATGNAVSMETILKVVADIENTSIADIKGKGRSKRLAETRHIAIYVARELLEYSYSELGSEFGGRDHTTILSAYNGIADRIKTDPSFEKRIKDIMNSIKEYKKI
ncbi:MAG: chromosomal replication initiator protein DnaA [Treponema sp.]|uniref:chromosomal replication initiator protein DnaA n=1 Tax=Treponema sp. TaxID=166 RepID=UPI00298E04EE|nr:chromosomal replication initiator protein DnaA [Treponema sp.]MCQ2601377.1 chromosomal replication initiator protein DnaA [Treponema sp.]